MNITEYLKSLWKDTSFSYRQKLAKALWISDYRWSSWQNSIIMNKIQEKIWTDQSPEKLDLLFEQYVPKTISDEERANIKEVEKSYYESSFNKERWYLKHDFNVSTEQIDRLIWYANTDTALDIAKNNKTFARAMQKATNVYWKRNLIWSWIQKSESIESTWDLEKAEQNRLEYNRRQQEWYQTSKDNLKTKYERGLEDLNQNEEAQAYFNTIKEVQNRRDEYNRVYLQWQENLNLWATTPTTSLSQSEAQKKLTNAQKNLF